MKTTNAPTNKKFTAYQVFIIAILALTQFTVVLDFMIISPLGDMLIKAMRLTPTQFGISVASYAVMAGVSGFLTAGFADRYDRKKLLLFFYIGFIVGSVLCGLTTSYVMLLGARIVTGFFGGVISSVSMAIVADIFPLVQRGRVTGFVQMGFAASQVLGIPIGLYIANQFNWQSPFFMIAAFSAIIWLAISVKMTPIVQHLMVKSDKSAFAHLWHTLSKPAYQTGFLTTALVTLGGFLLIPWTSSFAINNLNVSPQQLPMLFMATGLSSLFIMPVVGKLSDTISKFNIFAVAAAWTILTVIIYTNLFAIPFWEILSLNALMMIGVMGRIVPSQTLVISLPEMKDRGAFMSINSSLQQLSGGIAAGIGGLIIVQNRQTHVMEHYNTLGYITAITVIASGLALYRVNKLINKKTQQEGLSTTSVKETVYLVD